MPLAEPFGVHVTNSSEQVSRTEVFIRNGACSQLSQTLVIMMLTPICSRLPLRTCTLSCSRVHGNAESFLCFNRQHREGWRHLRVSERPSLMLGSICWLLQSIQILSVRLFQGRRHLPSSQSMSAAFTNVSEAKAVSMRTNVLVENIIISCCISISWWWCWCSSTAADAQQHQLLSSTSEKATAQLHMYMK